MLAHAFDQKVCCGKRCLLATCAKLGDNSLFRNKKPQNEKKTTNDYRSNYFNHWIVSRILF